MGDNGVMSKRTGQAALARLDPKRKSTDLEHVYALARLVWGKDAARSWLESTTAHLAGARPLDGSHTDGPARVLEALDAEMWGGAA